MPDIATPRTARRDRPLSPHSLSTLLVVTSITLALNGCDRPEGLGSINVDAARAEATARGCATPTPRRRPPANSFN